MDAQGNRKGTIMHADEILDALRYRVSIANPREQTSLLACLKHQGPATAAFHAAVEYLPNDNIYLQERSRIILKHEPNGVVEIYSNAPRFHEHICAYDDPLSEQLALFYPMAGKHRLHLLLDHLLISNEDPSANKRTILIPIELGFMPPR